MRTVAASRRRERGAWLGCLGSGAASKHVCVLSFVGHGMPSFPDPCAETVVEPPTRIVQLWRGCNKVHLPAIPLPPAHPRHPLHPSHTPPSRQVEDVVYAAVLFIHRLTSYDAAVEGAVRAMAGLVAALAAFPTSAQVTEVGLVVLRNLVEGVEDVPSARAAVEAVAAAQPTNLRMVLMDVPALRKALDSIQVSCLMCFGRSFQAVVDVRGYCCRPPT